MAPALADAAILITLLSLSSASLPTGIVLGAALVWAAFLDAAGCCPVDGTVRPSRLVGATAAGLIGVDLALHLIGHSVGAFWLGTSFATAVILGMAHRRLWYVLRAGTGVPDDVRRSSLIFGNAGELPGAVKALSTDPRYYPAGHVVVDGGDVELPGVPRLISEEVEELGPRNAFDAVLMTPGAASTERMRHLLSKTGPAGTEVGIAMHLPSVHGSKVSFHNYGGMLAVTVRRAAPSPLERSVKRTIDIALGSMLFLLALPAMAVIAILIKTTSPGPVIFRQERITKGGRNFSMLKFRTMVPDAAAHLAEADISVHTPFFKHPIDSVVTQVGRVLRQWSLDELPQLFNVITGDMSLVGPRPLPADQVAANMDLLAERHEVKSGITGWWQIQGRTELDVNRSLEMDRFYIENWSLKLDLYILCRTVLTVLSKEGAK